MEDVTVRIFIEYAQAGKFIAHELSHSVVVINFVLRLVVLRERHVIVEIEVAPVRRHQLEAPADALFVRFQLGQWRSRYNYDRHIAMWQMPITTAAVLS